MKITSVKVYKGTTFEVEIDNEKKIYLHADIIADFRVREGMELERTELRKIIYASNFRRAYQYALYCLDYRDYSTKEMRDKLIKSYKNENLCQAVVKKLEECGIISDERYAEKLARRFVEGKKYGLKRAKREIMLKGIGEYLAEDALQIYAEKFPENIAVLLRTKYAGLLTDRKDRKSIEKVKSSLVRYGYSYDEINHSVSEYLDCQED
ncbi:MAG: RecX family transcriptional regulator [Prevotella sp.]|nr:RecX family transcriptional regulator [Alistipes senegalensis]MCM1357753.1 RecX family transcriptional regulator [Prevotella sp.]MCM1473279.1 RecX family transcriptional regulator [Muribaculaceae bacterium]